MNRLLTIAILFATTFAISMAAPVEVGKKMPTYTLPDQWDKEHTLTSKTSAIVLSFEMSLSKMLNKWMDEKGTDVLADHNVHYISDIAPMPSVISKLFAMPKMKKYKHQILLNRDENFHKDYTTKDGKLMVIKLDKASKITEIVYVSTIAELEKELGLD